MAADSARTRAAKRKGLPVRSAAFCGLRRPRLHAPDHDTRSRGIGLRRKASDRDCSHLGNRTGSRGRAWSRLCAQPICFCSAIVLDMADIAADSAARVPLATWFRYRAAAERTQASVVLLAQNSCAKSSGELLLRFQPVDACEDEPTVFTGVEHRLEVTRRRFPSAPDKVVPLRKPPQSANAASWRSRTAWTGAR